MSAHLLVLGLLSASAAAGQSEAAACASAYYFSDGGQSEITTVDERGALKTRQVMTVRNRSSRDGEIRSTLETRTYDPRGSLVGTTASEARCERGDLLLDLTSSLPAQPSEGGRLTARRPVLLRYPASLRVGQTLESEVNFDLDGQSQRGLTTVNFSLRNRRVTAATEIDTPAGRRPGYEIRSILDIRFRILGVPVPLRYDLVEYFAPGFGVARTEALQDGRVVERSDVRVGRGGR